MMLAVAAGAGGCVLFGYLAALAWRWPADRRSRRELARLGGLVELHARAAQEQQERARVQYVRAEVEEATRCQAQLRARVAEDEAEQLRGRLEMHERTPCALCGLPLPLCLHGSEERLAWLKERGFPPAAGSALGPPLPGLDAPGGGLRWRAAAEDWAAWLRALREEAAARDRAARQADEGEGI